MPAPCELDVIVSDPALAEDREGAFITLVSLPEDRDALKAASNFCSGGNKTNTVTPGLVPGAHSLIGLPQRGLDPGNKCRDDCEFFMMA